MPADQASDKTLRALCGQWREDDGVDPRDEARGGTHPHKESRKSKQLCRQVAETLDLVLSGDCRDELLQNLHVVSVQPAPNSSRLLVTVQADLSPAEIDRETILQRLAAQAGRLRCEVAASVHRRRAPDLVFALLGGLPGG